MQNLAQLIWPALAVGYRYSAVATRMTRSAMLEVLREDYIRTARAKGLMQKLILSRHALKNAMLPVITVIALEFAFLIGGLVVTEQVFNLNGIGLLFVQAVAHRDYTLLQALIMLVAGLVHHRQLPDGHRVRVARPADPVPLIRADRGGRHGAEPAARSRARREVAGGRGLGRGRREFCLQPAARRRRRRHHRPDAGGGAAGARSSRRYDPVANDFSAMLAPPSRRALAGHRRLRPRRARAADLRLPYGAAGGLRRLGAGRHARAPCSAWPAPTSAVGSISICSA